MADNGIVNGTLIFDGECGMCTRSRDLVVRLDRHGRVATVPLQRAGTAERLGLTPEVLAESAWWLDSSGELYRGAEAVNAALSAVLGCRLPLLIYRLPGIRQAQDTVYRWVSTHRHRFPGTMPYCRSHPAEC
jgi:predicted DCC family thiol-disulfide oxidoreductase YuxK